MSSYTIDHKYGSRYASTKTAGELNSLGVTQHFLVVYLTTIPLSLVGYEILIGNLVLRALLAIYHLISNVRLWNSC